MLRIVLLDEVLHYTPRLEEADQLAVIEGVCQSRNAAVGVDFEEPGLFLGVLGDVDFVDFVGEAMGWGGSVGWCWKSAGRRGHKL